MTRAYQIFKVVVDIPQIFTNGDANLYAFIFNDLRCRFGLEISTFIKDIVGREQGFGYGVLDSSVVHYASHVLQFSAFIGVSDYATHYGCYALASSGNGLQGMFTFFNEIGIV